MIGYEALKNLTKEDIAKLEEFRAIAAEAEEAEKLINDAWLFKAGQKEVIVWKNEKEGIIESMNYDGSWRRDVAGEGYCIVKCDAATIFDYLYAEYVYKNKRPYALKDEKVTEMAKTCGYFREFLKQTKDEYDHMTR